MNNQFDELAKGLAQSVTRRRALRRFGIGLAAAVLAPLGLANKAQAKRNHCRDDSDCPQGPFTRTFCCICPKGPQPNVCMFWGELAGLACSSYCNSRR